MAINPTAEVRVSTTVDRPSLRRTEKQITQALNKVETMASRGGLLSKSYTQPLGKITGAVGEFEKSLEASNARVIAFGASAAIIYNVGRALEFTARAAIDLEHKLAEVNVILNASSSGLKQFGDELFSIAKVTGQTFDGVSQAALEFARQGLNMQETLQRTRDAMILVRLAGLDVQSSVESITATINSFNQTIISSTQLVNKLANVDAAFAVSSADLAKAISRVGSSAQDAGVSLDELIAMTTTAQQVTARGGAVIGNSLKTIFTRIQRPAVIANLEAFGMAVTDSSGATKPAIEVLKEFAGAYDNLTPQQRAVTAEMVGGVFQVNVLKAAIGDLGKRFSIYDRALGTSVSSTDEAIQRNAALNKTLKTLMNETMVNLLDMGARLGSITLSPAIAGVLESVNSAIDKLRDNAEADTIGIKMGKGILDGIGSILKGPGMMVLGALVGKLLFSFMKFSTDAVKTFAGMNEGARRQAEMQMLIQNILLKNPGLIDAAATSEQNLARVSEKILEVIRQRNFALAQSEKLSSNIARNIGAADMKAMNVMMGGGDTGQTEGAWRPVNMARGFVPNFSNRKERHAREVAGAISGGYKPGRIKEMTVPSFGRVTYNDAETVKKFPNFKQPAIMPPEKSDAGGAYKKKFQGKHGFNPYNAAAGFIPNFSKITDLAAVNYLGGKENWKKASQQEKDQAVAKYLKESTGKLSSEDTSISAWRTKEGISQGAPTNWVNHYEDGYGALAFDPEKFPQSHAAAKPFISILKKHQEDNTLKRVKEGNDFEDQLMEYFEIGVGAKGARNIPFDFIGPSTIPDTPEAAKLKKDIRMNDDTDIGDAHVGAGHSESLWISKFLRYNEMQSGSLGSAATIAEAFYPSGRDGKWDPKKKGIPVMDVAKQTGDGATYTDVLGGGTDGTVKGESTLWGVARDNWAGLKKELEDRGVDKNQIMHDRKKFVLNWMHDDIDKAKLEEALSFGGMIPNFATKILDRDQLAQYLGGAGVDAAFQSIVKQATQRGQLAETIVGTAGAGKTTLAVQKAGGKNFVTNAKDLSPDDQLIVVRAAKTVVDSPEFTQAGKITYLKGAKDVINQMRDQRSKQIREGTSETGFGRDPSMKFGSTSGVLTEALLAESYAGKLSVYERQADMSLKKAKEFEKLHELKGATATIGAFAPFTSGHQSMSEQADVDVAFVSKGANRQYDVGLSAKEKAKLIEMANPNIMAVPGSAGIQEHFEHGGKAYRMKKADTKVALGADRVAGGEEDLTKSFGAFKGVTAVEGRLDGVSGTKIRKAIVDGNTGILDANLPPQVSSVIKKNLPVLQKRAAFIQDRKDKASEAMTKLTSEEDAFKAKHGKAKRKGELAEITQARAEFREKKKILKKRMSGYGGRAWDRLGLQMNFASQGFVPSFAYKGMHQKDFGTTMVGRKGAMGTNMTPEQVQKMTAGMKMIRGPEGETLVVGTDMKGRSGRMIATGLTARKIKKSGPHWRTMLNEVPHLFDGLAYDLVGGVAGADWDPEGTSGAMGGIKFEDEFAAAHGLPKAGAKKGSDFRVAETIAKKLGTQKNIQAKVSLHERSKRDKTKVVDIASGFSKYLVDILSHNIKTYGLSSVTTPDRFQQAMEVLNQNPATKKDWVKYFGPMGTKSMGLIPNFFGPKGNKKKSWKGTAQRTKKHSPTGSTFFMTPGKSKGRGAKKTGVRKPGIRKGKKGLHKASGMIPNFAYEAAFAEGFTPNFFNIKKKKFSDGMDQEITSHDKEGKRIGQLTYDEMDWGLQLGYNRSSVRGGGFKQFQGLMEESAATGKPIHSGTLVNQIIDNQELLMPLSRISPFEQLSRHAFPQLRHRQVKGAKTSGQATWWLGDYGGKDQPNFDFKTLRDLKGKANQIKKEAFAKGLVENKVHISHLKTTAGNKTGFFRRDDSNLLAGGLVPNLAQDALKEAIGREMAAGYDKKQVKVGYDTRLKQSDGVGVYNSTEGSLTNAINMHLSSGKTITDLQTQGAHRGHVPNFVDSMDAGIGLMSMGMLASSMGGLKDATKDLMNQYEGSEEELAKLDEAIKAATKAEEEAADKKKQKEEKVSATDRSIQANIDKVQELERPAHEARVAAMQNQDAIQNNLGEANNNLSRVDDLMAQQRDLDPEAFRAQAMEDVVGRSAMGRRQLESGESLEDAFEFIKREGSGDETDLQEQMNTLQKKEHQALEQKIQTLEQTNIELEEHRKELEEQGKTLQQQSDAADANLRKQKSKGTALAEQRGKAQKQVDEADAELKAAQENTKNEKDKKKKRGIGDRVSSFIDKGGASALMMGAPMIGGMIKQGMDEQDLQGKAKVEGVTTGISTIATTAQMGAAAGPAGIAVAGTIGLAMAIRDYGNNLKKAKIQEKMADVGKQAETLGEKLNAVTAGGQGYMEGLDKLNSMMKDTSGDVSAEDLAKVRTKMAEALGDVPREFQAKFRAAAGDAEKIKEVFGEITQELSKAKQDLEGAKTGYGLQEKFAAGTFSFMEGRDRELFSRKAGTNIFSTEAQRIEAEMAIAIQNGMNKEAMQKAIDQGLDVDFSKLQNMQKFAFKGFSAMLGHLGGPDGVKGSDMEHIGKMIKEVYNNLVDGKKTAEDAANALAIKNHQDRVFNKQQKALNEEMRNFNLTIGKVVNGVKARIRTLNELSDNVKKFSIDFAQEDFRGARKLSDPFLTKKGKIEVDLADKSFDIKAKSLASFRKSVSDATAQSLNSIVKRFSDANEKVVGQAASLTAKSGKEQLGELARNRKAQQAMVPVIEKAFEAMASTPDKIGALDAAMNEMETILKKNGVSENAAEGAAQVVRREILENGREAVNKLAKSIQQRNQQLVIAERQAYWQRKQVELQERLERFGGGAEFVGDAGIGGLSKSFDGLSKVLEAQIKGAASGNIIDAGRADAMLLEQLVNKMGFKSLRDNLEGLAPMLSNAIAGRSADIQRQVAFAQRLTSIANPGLALPTVDAEGIAIDQLASQLKLNSLPDDVAALRRNSEILNKLISLQTIKIVDKNEEAFDKALKLNGIPENMRAVALGTKEGVDATNKVGTSIFKSGFDTVTAVSDTTSVNTIGFSGLLGASTEIQRIAANLPRDFVAGNAAALGATMANVRAGLEDAIGNINTNVSVTMDELKSPIRALDDQIALTAKAIEGNKRQREADKNVATNKEQQLLKLSQLQAELANQGKPMGNIVRDVNLDSAFAGKGKRVDLSMVEMGLTSGAGDLEYKNSVGMTMRGGGQVTGTKGMGIEDFLSGAAHAMGNVRENEKTLGGHPGKRKRLSDEDISRNVRSVLINQFGLKDADGSEVNAPINQLMAALIKVQGGAHVTGINYRPEEETDFRKTIKDILKTTTSDNSGKIKEQISVIEANIKSMEESTGALEAFKNSLTDFERENLLPKTEFLGAEGKFYSSEAEAKKSGGPGTSVTNWVMANKSDLLAQRQEKLDSLRDQQRLGGLGLMENRDFLRAGGGAEGASLASALEILEGSTKALSYLTSQGAGGAKRINQTQEMELSKIWGQEATNQLKAELTKGHTVQEFFEATFTNFNKKQKERESAFMKAFQAGGGYAGAATNIESQISGVLGQIEERRQAHQRSITQMEGNKTRAEQAASPENRQRIAQLQGMGFRSPEQDEELRNLQRQVRWGAAQLETLSKLSQQAAPNLDDLNEKLQNLRGILNKIVKDEMPKTETGKKDATAHQKQKANKMQRYEKEIADALKAQTDPNKMSENAKKFQAAIAKGATDNDLAPIIKRAREQAKKEGKEGTPEYRTALEKAIQEGLAKGIKGVITAERTHTGTQSQTNVSTTTGAQSGERTSFNRSFADVNIQPQLFHDAIQTYTGMGLETLEMHSERIRNAAAKFQKERKSMDAEAKIDAELMTHGTPDEMREEDRLLEERAAQRRKRIVEIEAEEDLLKAGSEAVALVKKQTDVEEKRKQLLKDLNLKNVKINQAMFEQVGMSEKLQKLLEAFGDLQSDMAKDELNQSIARTRKSQFLGGKSTSILGSGISEALMGQVGRTDFKKRIAESRSGTLEEIKRRRTARLRGADFSGLLGGASRRISEGTTETQVDSYGMGDAGTVFEFDEKAKATMDALKKYGLEEGMSPEKMKEWAVKNQDRLMQIFNDPALQIDDAQVKHLRELFNVMSEGEALFIGLRQTMDENNMTYDHQLDLYRKGLITFEELNGSFQSLEKAAIAASEFIDADKLTAQMRATAQNAADTFARTLHRAMNDAASGDEVKKATDDLVEQYITNPAGFRPATPEEIDRRNKRNKKEQEEITKNKTARLGSPALTDKEYAEFQKNNPEMFKGGAFRGNEKDEEKLRKFERRKQKQRNLRDKKEAEQPKTIAEIQEGLTRAAMRYNDELHRSHEMYDAGLAPIGRAQAAFNKLTELHKAGQSGLDAAMFEEERVKMLQQTAKDYDRSLQLTSEGLRAGTVAASDGVAAVDQWTQHIVKYGQATMTAEQRASKIAELREAQGESAAKFNDEFEMTKELFDANVLSTQDLAAALDATNEAAIRAGNYGFKEFSNSLRMGFTYTTQDFAKDIDSMGREFGQDFKSGVSGAFSEAIKGTKNLKEAFGDAFAAMADKMLDKSLDIGVSALMSPLGFNKGGIVKGYSSGGSVTGGSGTKDDVPAYLTKGEYVIKKSSVQAYGKDFFDSLNKGSVVQANRGGAISRLVKQQTEKQRELDAAGIRQFSYKWADPEKTKEDWLGRDTGQAVMNTSSDFRVNMGTTLTPERLDAIQAVADKYPDVAKNLDRDLFDQSKLEIGQGNYKVRLKNRFVYDNMKRPDQGMMRTDTRLSAAALTDENNPQNQYKFEKREAFFDYQRERLDYIKEQQEAHEKFQREKEGRRWGFLFGGAALGLGGMLAGGGRRGTYMNFATGGMSPDNVAALLTGGEYVIRKDVVDKHGTQFFDKLNKGELPKFNVGGLVGAPTSRQNGRNDSSPVQRDITSDRTGGATSNTNNISITVNVDSNGNVGAEAQENQGEAGNLTEEESKELAGKIKSSVLNVIIEQKRPGGMLYE